MVSPWFPHVHHDLAIFRARRRLEAPGAVKSASPVPLATLPKAKVRRCRLGKYLWRFPEIRGVGIPPTSYGGWEFHIFQRGRAQPPTSTDKGRFPQMDGLCHGNSEIRIEVDDMDDMDYMNDMDDMDDMDDDWGHPHLWKPSYGGGS